MTPTNDTRHSYLKAKDICPDSIPGRACLAGHWDKAPGMIEHAEGRR